MQAHLPSPCSGGFGRQRLGHRQATLGRVTLLKKLWLEKKT
jgi:hypothetical protein